jgi:hypothetical protein
MPADLAGYAAVVAEEIDRVFHAGMAYIRAGGGRDLVARHGGPEAVGLLIQFRTALAWPGRRVTWAQLAVVTRYRDQGAVRASVESHARAGSIVLDEDGLRATDAGLDFVRELYGIFVVVMAEVWPGVEDLATLAGLVLAEAGATGAEAFAAMAAPYEPPGAPAGLLLLNRLGTLRYHRADAHAAAWGAAGLTAAQVQALDPDDPGRVAIEVETNRRAAPPFAAVSATTREGLLSGLRALA